jgi:signal transduction histidine kinase
MITVSAYNEGNQLIVCVEDNGMGMTQEHQSSIFQPRFTSKKKGTGLGLTITQSIVNQMNGSISVSSVHEVGTVFTVSFLATE